jgi:hypothetical protein
MENGEAEFFQCIDARKPGLCGVVNRNTSGMFIFFDVLLYLFANSTLVLCPGRLAIMRPFMG